MNKRYVVRLDAEERQRLQELVKRRQGGRLQDPSRQHAADG